MNFQTMTIEFIIDWCKANNQIEWLKAEITKTKECKVYPRVKVKNEQGKIVSKADKTQPYTLVSRPISFIDIKTDFVNAFMPEIAPKRKEKKPTMFDIINAL